MVEYIVFFVKKEHGVVFHAKRVFFRRVFLLLLSALALVCSPVYGVQVDRGFQNYEKDRQNLREINQKFYVRRAHEGHPGAQFNLGLLLLSNSFHHKQTALSWITKASDQNYAPALHIKGLMAIEDKWPGLNVVEGRKYLAKAAQLGFKPSHINLAKSLVFQSPVDKNLALEWLRKGARLKDSKCMAMLGKAYDVHGFIGERPSTAYFWYTLAWFNRNKSVKQALIRLAQQLTQQERVKVGFLLESHYELPLKVIEHENAKIFPYELNS